MKRIKIFFLFVVLLTLACSATGISIPVSIPTMDVAQIPTMIVLTAQALATAATATSTSIIPSDTPIVVTATSTGTATSTVTSTATNTETSTAVPSATSSSIASIASFTTSPTSTFISSTQTVAAKTATVFSSATPIGAQPTIATPFVPTSIPPTAVPPTAVPPTAVPPTAVPPTAIPPVAVPDCPLMNTSHEAQVIDLINVERAKAGLSALSAQGQLGSAARLHSTDMACNNYFSHTGLDGSTIGDRAERQGYNWSSVGENIAAGYSSPESVVQGWMNSPGHKANILGADYTEIGIGYAFGAASDYGAYWTAVFASP